MTIVQIPHGTEYTHGTRCLMLAGRHKDGVEHDRKILRVSYSKIDFCTKYNSLLEQMEDGERIYASAGPRSIEKAIRNFREKQLESEYSGVPEDFYKRLETTWFSSLMDTGSQQCKLWLFDCDSDQDFLDTIFDLGTLWDLIPEQPYTYDTKNGHRIVVPPFDMRLLSDKSKSLIHKNPFMLWAYKT